MAIKKNLANTMSSISTLQETCNTLEKKLTAKLTALEAALDTSGVKVTEATFEEFGGNVNELGLAKITASADGNNSAFILTVRTAVSISR